MVIVLLPPAEKCCEVCQGPKEAGRGRGIRRCVACSAPPPPTTRACGRCGEDQPLDEYVPKGRVCATCRSRGYPAERRKCMRCAQEKWPDEFALSSGTKGRPGRLRRRRVCKDCTAREQAEREQRAQERITTWTDPATGRPVRRCGKCREVKDLEDEYYNEHSAEREPDPIRRKGYRCKTCCVARSRENYECLKSDPAALAEYRKYQAAYRREWRKRNPGREQEARRRYLARVRADPERYARHLESVRLGHHLRQQRRGKKTRPRATAQSSARQEGFTALPAFPLGDALQQIAKRDDVTDAAAETRFGAAPRTVDAWVSGERETVQFDVADRVLQTAGLLWWEVWPPEEYPGVAEVWEG